MGLANVTEQEENVLEAARAHADALAVVLLGKPSFSAMDAAKVVTTRNQLWAEAINLALERTPGPSIPHGGPLPPDLVKLIERFMPRAQDHDL